MSGQIQLDSEDAKLLRELSRRMNVPADQALKCAIRTQLNFILWEPHGDRKPELFRPRVYP